MSQPNPNLYVVDGAGEQQVAGTGSGSGQGGDVTIHLSEDDLTDGDRTIFLCKEFLNVYPVGYLSRVTAWWIFILLVAGAVDVATMRHVIGTKFTDAFGNLTAPVAVVWVAATLTLMVFLLVSFLWKKRGEK